MQATKHKHEEVEVVKADTIDFENRGMLSLSGPENF
jgi:hypothetical protein